MTYPLIIGRQNENIFFNLLAGVRARAIFRKIETEIIVLIIIQRTLITNRAFKVFDGSISSTFFYFFPGLKKLRISQNVRIRYVTLRYVTLRVRVRVRYGRMADIESNMLQFVV